VKKENVLIHKDTSLKKFIFARLAICQLLVLEFALGATWTATLIMMLLNLDLSEIFDVTVETRELKDLANLPGNGRKMNEIFTIITFLVDFVFVLKKMMKKGNVRCTCA
jgi:hypothetical protein